MIIYFVVNATIVPIPQYVGFPNFSSNARVLRQSSGLIMVNNLVYAFVKDDRLVLEIG